MGRKIVSLSNNTYVTLDVDNPRFIKIYPLVSEVERRNDKNDIIELNYNEEFKISVGQELVLDKQVYKPFSISRIESTSTMTGCFCLFNYDLNKSTNFILPLLIPDLTVTRQHLRWTDYCNCFVGTEEDGDYGNHIYLLYRYNGDKSFLDFEKFLTNYKYFVEKIEVDNFHSLYKFDINPIVIKDYQLILEGKYSSISDFSKKLILNFHFLDNFSPTYKILYKTDDRKLELEKKYEVSIPHDVDLYDKFVFEEEMYMNKYKIKNNIYNEFRAENPDYC